MTMPYRSRILDCSCTLSLNVGQVFELQLSLSFIVNLKHETWISNINRRTQRPHINFFNELIFRNKNFAKKREIINKDQMDNLNLSFFSPNAFTSMKFHKNCFTFFLRHSFTHTLSLSISSPHTHTHVHTHNNNTHSQSFSVFYLTFSFNICNILSLSLFLNTHYISFFLTFTSISLLSLYTYTLSLSLSKKMNCWVRRLSKA